MTVTTAIASTFGGKSILSALQITHIIISNSISRTHWFQKTSASGTRSLHWTLTLRVFSASSFASALALVFVISSISSANWVLVFGTRIAVSVEGLILFLALSESDELLLRTSQRTQISVSDSVGPTNRHEHFGAELAPIKDRRTLSVGLLHHSDTFHHTFIIVGESVNSANGSVQFLALTRGQTRSFGLGYLLSTREDALVLEGVASERADGLELLSSAVAGERRVVGFPVVSVARSIIGEFSLVIVESALVEVSDSVSTANR